MGVTGGLADSALLAALRGIVLLHADRKRAHAQSKSAAEVAAAVQFMRFLRWRSFSFPEVHDAAIWVVLRIDILNRQLLYQRRLCRPAELWICQRRCGDRFDRLHSADDLCKRGVDAVVLLGVFVVEADEELAASRVGELRARADAG